MKYTWEIDDIQAGRRIWSRSNASNGECVIVYQRGSAGENEWAIASLTDGMVYTRFMSKEKLLDRIQGYRPLNIMEPFMKFVGTDIDWRGAHGATARLAK